MNVEKKNMQQKGMVSMREQLKELKRLVDGLPRNVVHIHMHDGGNDEEHHHESHHSNNAINNDSSNETSSSDTHTGVVNENEQHIHMYMHLVTDDHHDHHDDDHHGQHKGKYHVENMYLYSNNTINFLYTILHIL